MRTKKGFAADLNKNWLQKLKGAAIIIKIAQITKNAGRLCQTFLPIKPGVKLMRNRRFLALRAAMLAAITACAFFLTACELFNRLKNSSAVEPSSQSALSGELTVFTLFGGDVAGAAEYRALISDFITRNPDVKVTDLSQAYSETTPDDLAAMFAAGSEPDVLFYYTGKAAFFENTNGVVPISEIREQYPSYAKDVLDLSLESANRDSPAFFAVPVRGFYEGLFLNTDLFEKYELAQPNSWETLVEAVSAFSGTGIVPIAASLSETPHYLVDHLILSQGGLSEYKKKLAAKTGLPDSWNAAFERLTELYSLGAFGPNADTLTDSEATELFVKKKAAMRVDGSWLAARLLDEGLEGSTEVIDFPTTPDGAKRAGQIIGGFTSGYYITRKGWDNIATRPAAAALADILTTRGAVRSMCGAASMPSVRISPGEQDPLLVQSARKLSESLVNLTMPLDARLDDNAWGAFTQGTLSVIRGDTEAKTLFETIYGPPQ